MDSGEIVVSSIRTGMKREFAMMMKAQSEMGVLPAGRRRTTRSQSTVGSSTGNVQSANKVSRKVRGSESKKAVGHLEADLVVERRETEKVGAELREDRPSVIESPVPQVRDTDGDSIHEDENSIPTKLKDLLQTGLLEGLHVRGGQNLNLVELFRGLEYYVLVMNARKERLSRLINLRCTRVVEITSTTIHLFGQWKESQGCAECVQGQSFRVTGICDPERIGRSNYMTAFCINCKELIPEASAGRSMLLCDSCVLPKESDASNAKISDTSNRSVLAGPSAPASSSRPPVVSESAQISSDGQPQTKRQGKLTRKDLRMHKSVLAEDVLPEGTALSYVLHGEKKLEGYKKHGGIFCTCCREVVSPSQFEAHAGFASRRKPYMSIYTSNGVSLHQLSLELSRSRKSSTEEHDDLCSICADGGDLLCCANCPRAFHTECVGLSVIPQGIWYCKYCKNMFEKEKLAEADANAIAAGRVPGVDPLEAITQRCIRIVETFEPDIGGCAICRGHDFCKSGFTARTIIICDQCEKEYHVGCLKDLKALPEEEWFCGKPCSNIYSALQKLIGDGEQRLPEALSDALKMKCEGQSLQKNPELGIRWRLLRGKKAAEDTRVWLSGAVNIFHVSAF
ncbi:UNVERIFIED_CONTAM: Increased DNA methylation 1 [Sesamum latifolium]|uniref:Increased DNA methylation 1 n=1 Tax=Sesamum latifolium TaxID=2727402 RepID=A0AAW2Y4A7_9LAMI